MTARWAEAQAFLIGHLYKALLDDAVHNRKQRSSIPSFLELCTTHSIYLVCAEFQERRTEAIFEQAIHYVDDKFNISNSVPCLKVIMMLEIDRAGGYSSILIIYLIVSPSVNGPTAGVKIPLLDRVEVLLRA
jgi:hypothetical protein